MVNLLTMKLTIKMRRFKQGWNENIHKQQLINIKAI